MKLMPRQILVPLRGTDRIEQVLPNLEQVAGPGTTIVFFVHYGLSGFRKLMEQLLAIQLGIRPGRSDLTDKRNASRKPKVLLALEALKRKGAQIEVNLYGLSEILQKYAAEKEIAVVARAPQPLGSDECRDKLAGFDPCFQDSRLPVPARRESRTRT
ncbi:MAG: hypothetical protein ACREQW_23490 [Candidatus Binatia bacterium]